MSSLSYWYPNELIRWILNCKVICVPCGWFWQIVSYFEARKAYWLFAMYEYFSWQIFFFHSKIWKMYYSTLRHEYCIYEINCGAFWGFCGGLCGFGTSVEEWWPGLFWLMPCVPCFLGLVCLCMCLWQDRLTFMWTPGVICLIVFA